MARFVSMARADLSDLSVTSRYCSIASSYRPSASRDAANRKRIPGEVGSAAAIRR